MPFLGLRTLFHGILISFSFVKSIFILFGFYFSCFKWGYSYNLDYGLFSAF